MNSNKAITDLLSKNGMILVVIQIFRLLFGGYLVIIDQFQYKDTGSALTVLAIYMVLGLFTVLFVRGKTIGLLGILTLSIILIIFNTIFTILTLGDSVEAGLHDPSTNIWPTILRYIFFMATLFYSIKVLREKKKGSVQ